MSKEKIEKLEEISQLENENKKFKHAEIAHVRKEALNAIEELPKSHEKEIKEYKHATQLLGNEKQALLSQNRQLQTHLEQYE